jgi:F0F1-type ATP synthase assembly protein I
VAKAYQWASRIMVVSMEMVLPGLGGYWLDKTLGTKVLFMLVGFALGCTAASVHLIRLTRSEKNRSVDD